MLSRLTCILLICATLCAHAQEPATLSLVGSASCAKEQATCEAFDAVVFVHGIYGDDSTFRNPETGFDWPTSFPRQINGRSIDVYRLNYQSALLSWAKEENPKFDVVANSIFQAMAPLRKRNYRSIGFVAHSLGGNFVSTYIHSVLTYRGHPERAQNAYYITLATPVLGADIASIANPLKTTLGINDDLLNSLSKENLYLRMLKDFRAGEGSKEKRRGCRAVHLHAAFEQARLGPITVVTPDSAARSIKNMAVSPIVGFQLDHFEIAKPRSVNDPVFTWVLDRVIGEFDRLAKWDVAHANVPAKHKLCKSDEYLGEP